MHIILLGNHWLKPPPMARHHDDDYELSHNKKSWQGTWCCHWKRNRKTKRVHKKRRRPQPVICLPTSQNPCWNLSWLRNTWTTRNDPAGLCCECSAQPCPTLCDLMDYSPPGISVHGTIQARILKWVSMLYSRGSSRPRDQTHIFVYPALTGRFFTTSDTWEALERTLSQTKYGLRKMIDMRQPGN